MIEIPFSIWAAIYALIFAMLAGGIFLICALYTLQHRRVAAINRRGLRLLKAGAWEEAASEFRKAIAINPFDAASHCNLGFALLFGSEAWVEALFEFNRAIQLCPTMAEPYFGRGHVLLHCLGCKERGQADLALAREFNPRVADLWPLIRRSTDTPGSIAEPAAPPCPSSEKIHREETGAASPRTTIPGGKQLAERCR